MKKFEVAWNGLLTAFCHKAVFIQGILAIFAIIGGFVIKLNTLEWCIFILCITLVISLEIVNTCIEYICNYIQPNHDQRIKVIKDMASGSVLCVSIGAFIICLLITVNKIGGLL